MRILEALGVATGEVIGAAFFAGGDGGHGSVRLQGCDAIWQMTHLFVHKVGDYRERVSLYFNDAVYELTFPSPYLQPFPHEAQRVAVGWRHLARDGVSREL